MDKEIALLLAEMLIKQDQTTEQIQETNKILRDFVDTTVIQLEHFDRAHEKQEKFNEKQLSFNERQQTFNERQQTFNDRQIEFNERFAANWEQQQGFNKQMVSELKEIKRRSKLLLRLKKGLKPYKNVKINLKADWQTLKDF